MRVILRVDRTTMSCEYGFTDGKSDTHAFIGIGFFVADIGITIEDIRDPFRIDPNPIIFDVKSYGRCIVIDIT